MAKKKFSDFRPSTNKEKLAERDKQLAAIIDFAPFGAHVYELKANDDLLFIGYNKSADRILGISHEQFINKTIEEAFPPLKETPIPHAYRQVAKTGVAFHDEQISYHHGAINGGFEVHAIKTMDNCVTVFFYDITERKRSESLIHVQKDLAFALSNCVELNEGLLVFLRAALHVAGFDYGGVYLTDASGTITLLVHQGLSDDFIKEVSVFLPQTPSAQIVMKQKPVYSEHATLGIPLDAMRVNEKLTSIAILPILHESKVIGCLNVASHENTEISMFAREALETISLHIGSTIARLKAEQAVRESETRMRQLASATFEGIVFSENGIILEANEQLAALFHTDLQNVIGRPVFDFVSEEFIPFIEEKIRSDFQGTYEYMAKRPDHSTFPAEVQARIQTHQGKKIRVAAIRDITLRKRAEEELQKAEKLKSMGILAGGIAHDFNNLLGGIYGFIELAHISTADAVVSEYLAQSLSTLGRAKGLTQQLLTFAKGGDPIRKTAPLFPFVKDCALFALSGSHVSCHFFVPADLWTCEYDKAQIGQVVDNLIINALQAMPMGGSIEVSAQNGSVIRTEHPLLTDGRYVSVSFKDTGVGIPKEIISRIFDPFFTTKQKGSGLGLATAYSIVNRHGGCIEVASHPATGTVFTVFLPAGIGSPDEILQKKSQTKLVNGRVLIMDDEEVILQTIAEMLKIKGLNCVCVKDGQQALKEIDAAFGNHTPFAAVILDLTVPGGMGGMETILEIRKKYADIPVFVASGYAADPIIANPRDFGFTDSISKPFRLDELTDMIVAHLKPTQTP